MFRKFLVGAATAAAMFVGTNGASAQAVSVECGSFTNSPFICIKNDSLYPVAAIDCDGYRVQMVNFGGYIPPGLIGVGKFNKSFCTRATVITQDGRTHSVSSLDTKAVTKITISPWNW